MVELVWDQQHVGTATTSAGQSLCVGGDWAAASWSSIQATLNGTVTMPARGWPIAGRA